MSVENRAGCEACGAEPATSQLGDAGPLCDACFDERISARTGYPRLPDAPAPIDISDADGTPHTMSYRMVRAPSGGISVRLAENTAPGEGFEFEAFGDHEADPEILLDQVTLHARTQMARRYLIRDASGSLMISDPADGGAPIVAGRISCAEPDGTPLLIVDGRGVSWEELGRAMPTYEGWQFSLRITESFDDPAAE